MNNKLVAGLAAAGVLAGGGTAAALITAAGTAPASANTITAVSTTATMPAGSQLASLAAKGTITQSQATAVTSAFTQQIRAHWGDSHGMRGHSPGMMGGSHMGWAN